MNLYDRILLSDGAGAGGAPAAGAEQAAVTPPPVTAANPAPASSAAGSPAGGAATMPPAGEIYRPEGIADHLLGKSNNETIDNLKKVVDGYRERDAQSQIPDKVEAYSEFTGDIPEPIKPHLETLKADPLYKRMAEFALEKRVPLPVYQGLVQQFLSVGGEMGMLEPPVDFAAEKAALVPEAAKHLPAAEQTAARERRMNDNFAYVDQMVERGKEKGGFDKETGEFVKAMLGDTARGHQFLEWARSLTGGAQQVYLGGGSPNAGDPKADLQRRAALPENTFGHVKFDRASWDQLDADYKKVHGV